MTDIRAMNPLNLNIPLGTTIYLGAPAKPMEPGVVRRIVALMATVENLLEAHLPQCWIPDLMPVPAVVLMLIVNDKWTADAINAVGAGLSRILPAKVHLDVWPLASSNALVPKVRGANCRIFG